MANETRLGKNRSGVWEVRWTEKDATGRARTRSVTTHQTDERLAEAFRRSFERQERENAARAGGVRVGDLLDAYEAWVVARGVGRSQRYCIGTIRNYFAAFTPDELTPEAMLDYRKTRCVKDATLRRELAALVAVLSWAVKHRKIPAAPAIDLPPSGPARTTFLDNKKQHKLFELAKRDETRDGRLSRTGRFICIALETGARKAAIEGLTWDRVDFEKKQIDFRDLEARTTKKRRVVTVLTDRLMPVLQRAFDERGQLSKLVWGASGVCRERTPAELAEAARYVLDGPGDIRRTWATFVAKHGFDVTPHVLRHTRITTLLHNGVPMWDVSGLVGASPKVIQEVYGHHVTDERMQAQANRRADPV